MLSFDPLTSETSRDKINYVPLYTQPSKLMLQISIHLHDSWVDSQLRYIYFFQNVQLELGVVRYPYPISKPKFSIIWHPKVMRFLEPKPICVPQNLRIHRLSFLDSLDESGLYLNLGEVGTSTIMIQPETLNCFEHPLVRNHYLRQYSRVLFAKGIYGHIILAWMEEELVIVVLQVTS